MSAGRDPLLRPVVAGSARILTLDIETMPMLAAVFQLRGQDYISPGSVVQTGGVGCWAARWYGERRVMFASTFHDGYEPMIGQMRDLLDQADIVVSFNGKRFDNKHLRTAMVGLGLPAPTPWRDVDLLVEWRRLFTLPSNKLDEVAKYLGIGQKIKHEGMALWLACMDGDAKAWGRMKRYNVGDVRLTEDLYDRLRGWMPNHPHVLTTDALSCNQCGSTDLTREGRDYRAVVIDYALYRCNGCAGLVRAGHERRVARTRGVA